MIRNFIFDLDGTLVDSLPGIARALKAALPSRSQWDGDVRNLIGPPVRTILRSLAGPCAESDLDGMVARFRETYDSVAWRDTVPYPGVKELLRELNEAGKRVFVVTNKPLKPAMKILRRLELLRWMEDVLTPDSVSPPFPGKSEMLRALMNQWQLNPGETVLIGDTVDDYRAAQSAAVKSVFMAHGYGCAQIASEAPEQPVFAHPGLISQTFLTPFVKHGVAL